MDIYRSIILITTLKKVKATSVDGEDSLVLNLPFKVYGQNIIMLGKDITYRLNDMSNLGKQVIAKVDYRLEDMPGNSSVKGEALVAKNFAGNMGQDWDTLKTDSRYNIHAGTTKFCEWDVDPVEP